MDEGRSGGSYGVLRVIGEIDDSCFDLRDDIFNWCGVV